ncbi:hypothetical protein PQX77_009624 [Marasmius sp. AFHP31]|nr:hypothetical protein PQX77_009624 [Marasmius sp. AFHP31]
MQQLRYKGSRMPKLPTLSSGSKDDGNDEGVARTVPFYPSLSMIVGDIEEGVIVEVPRTPPNESE